MCEHLRACRKPWLSYFKWYTGLGMGLELLCRSCADQREQGKSISSAAVCETCFEYATTEIGDLAGARGKPQVRIRSETLDSRLQRTVLPAEAGTVIDISPVMGAEGRSVWLLLAENGQITRFDADSGDWTHLARAHLIAEPDHKPWCGHVLRPHLHSAPGGDFAAIVNDYGRYGQIIDLRSGRVTLELAGGDYHPDTVPFSFAFARVGARIVAIHRTSWNRLDFSDPATGELLSARGPTSYQRGEERPPHYLDYFHGALRVSPNGASIVDDGWVWHPVGIPTTWSLEQWVGGNVWESDDGPTRLALCYRAYFWDHAVIWLDDTTIAVGGLGDDDNEMVDGVRVFDISLPAETTSADRPQPREITSFAGPAGMFFSDGRQLFSSHEDGLSRWDISDGSRTGQLPEFAPTHHHADARELVQVIGNTLVRLSI